MVKAILAGRKTQTRRIAKCQKDDATELAVDYMGHATKGEVAVATYRAFPGKGTATHGLCECPYGVPGDRLWVKETFMVVSKNVLLYRADFGNGKHVSPWKPSIFMPRKFYQFTSADLRTDP